MRFAVIADIHGNCLALEAVLADIKRHGVTDIVNLGDHVGGPLEARRTADLLMQLKLPSVRGNHDRMVVDDHAESLGLSDKAALSQLERRHLDWLASLPPALLWHDDILLCHGTPSNDSQYWLERVNADGTIRMATHGEIAAELAGIDNPVILCGHTHIPRAVQLKDGRLIVNPGSVGLPAYDHDDPILHLMETGTPAASYAILEKADGRWDVTYRLVGYDNLAMAQMARAAGRPEWASALAAGWVR